MILGIGIDAVEVARFSDWHNKTPEQLQKIFSLDEMEYCLSGNAQTSAERFAARFAAREAFFKAFHAMCDTHNIENHGGLFTIQKLVHVERNAKGVPTLHIDWQTLLPELKYVPVAHISLTHTKNIASAIVVLEQS